MTFRNRHLDEATLALFAGGDLAQLAQRRASRHAAQCQACQAAIESYARARDEMAQARAVPEVDFEALAHQIRVAALQAAPAARSASWRWRLGAGAGLAAGALALALIGDVPEPPAQLSASADPAQPDSLGTFDHADAQVTVEGRLTVRAFHPGSGMLTITEYYAP